MNCVIYYFSGTGNSLAIAKKLALSLDCPYYPISKFSNEIEDARNIKIVLVFPVYLAQGYGLPIIVKGKIERLKSICDKDIVGICTCGGFKFVNAIPALCNLKKICRTSKRGGFDAYAIKLPMNNLEYPSPLINQDQKKMFADSEREIGEISRNIQNGTRSLKFILQSDLSIFMKPLYVLLRHIYAGHVYKMAKVKNSKDVSYSDAIRLTDRNIEVNANCNGCGICMKICPANNIQIINDRPKFNNQCEMCTACDEWCPQDAIHHWCRTQKLKYHHPEITLNEMKR